MRKQSDLIRDLFQEQVDLGEVPYQAARSAVQAIDIDGDVERGMRELDVVLRGIGPFRAKLRELQNAAQNTLRR